MFQWPPTLLEATTRDRLLSERSNLFMVCTCQVIRAQMVGSLRPLNSKHAWS